MAEVVVIDLVKRMIVEASRSFAANNPRGVSPAFRLLMDYETYMAFRAGLDSSDRNVLHDRGIHKLPSGAECELMGVPIFLREDGRPLLLELLGHRV